jgi:hypothetical protein
VAIGKRRPGTPGAGEEDIYKAVRELTQRVAELEAKAIDDGHGAPALELSDDKLAALATSIYRTRQQRRKYFDPALFAEPAWDMLLDLFINRVRGARVSTTSLCLAAGAPQATGVRWIGLLVAQGLIRRYRAPDDARLMLVDITPQGYQLMRRCLSDSVTRFEWPSPE